MQLTEQEVGAADEVVEFTYRQRAEAFDGRTVPDLWMTSRDGRQLYLKNAVLSVSDDSGSMIITIYNDEDPRPPDVPSGQPE